MIINFWDKFLNFKFISIKTVHLITSNDIKSKSKRQSYVEVGWKASEPCKHVNSLPLRIHYSHVKRGKNNDHSKQDRWRTSSKNIIIIIHILDKFLLKLCSKMINRIPKNRATSLNFDGSLSPTIIIIAGIYIEAPYNEHSAKQKYIIWYTLAIKNSNKFVAK